MREPRTLAESERVKIVKKLANERGEASKAIKKVIFSLLRCSPSETSAAIKIQTYSS